MSIPAFIYDSIRTPRGKGKKDGSLHEVKPVDLLAGQLRELQKRNDLDTSMIDDLVIGCVSPIGEQGANIGAVAALVAEYHESVPAMQIDRYCASSLECVGLAAMKIMSGMEQLVVAGGVESMSRVKMASAGTPWADDPATSLKTEFIPQGISADLMASLEGISREEVDSFALKSHQKAAIAQANGYFDKSVIPVYDEDGLLILDKDETIRPNTSLEKMSGLQASFEFFGAMGFDTVALQKFPQLARITHIHHAGNSSGIVDGAGLLLIGSERMGKELNLKPRGRIVASSVVSTDSTVMVKGPVPATEKVLNVAGMTLDQIDLFEVNEAFAAVPIWYQRTLDIDPDKINVNGGAIALGHPLGATGGILMGTILDELERRNLRYGLVTMCAACGIGIATIVECLA
ncbi:acetyl-CoA C-acetyltransferase [bacterium]|nr:acetyl-CoA C-acetyltransferase [bacterium]